MPAANYLLYPITITTLHPSVLHIGTGVELLKDYDYAVTPGYTWRLNEPALREAQDPGDPDLARRLMEIPPAQFLKQEDFRRGSPFFRYVVPGEPRSEKAGAVLREQIKDIHDRPYIPGSSLKGALRTALAWHAWGETGQRLDLNRLKDKREWAAQGYERALFGKDPNHDALRALQVSDSAPAGQNALILVNASVINRGAPRGQTIPVEMEAVKGGVTFTASIKMDLALFSEWAKRHNLSLNDETWLRSLPLIIQQYTRQRIKTELAWFQNNEDFKAVRDFYKEIDEFKVRNDRCILQLGWGGGWESNTFGSRLRENPVIFEELVKKHRLARGLRQPGQPFPKSRRIGDYELLASGHRQVPRRGPLGWVLVELGEPRHA